jgi:hypothetical protein
MRNSRSLNLYYSIFFIGFYVSIDFDKNGTPRESGIYFVTILGMGMWFTSLNLFRFFTVEFNYNVLLFAGIVAIVTFNYWLFREQNFHRLEPLFSHFGKTNFRSKRKILAIILFLIFFICTVGSAVINNEGVKDYLLY